MANDILNTVTAANAKKMFPATPLAPIKQICRTS